MEGFYFLSNLKVSFAGYKTLGCRPYSPSRRVPASHAGGPVSSPQHCGIVEITNKDSWLASVFSQSLINVVPGPSSF